MMSSHSDSRYKTPVLLNTSVEIVYCQDQRLQRTVMLAISLVISVGNLGMGQPYTSER